MTRAVSNANAAGTKGDIVIGSGTNTSGVLTVGTNNFALIADSTQTLGVKWSAITTDPTPTVFLLMGA